MTVETHVRVWQEDGQFIAHAMPLDLASSGPTSEAAREALREALDLFVETARGHGTLDVVLEEAGYRFDGTRWIAPRVIEQHELHVAV